MAASNERRLRLAREGCLVGLPEVGVDAWRDGKDVQPAITSVTEMSGFSMDLVTEACLVTHAAHVVPSDPDTDAVEVGNVADAGRAIEAGQVIRLLHGADLLPAVGALADDLVAWLWARCDVELSLATAPFDGLGLWRDSDVIVIPLLGALHVSLVGPTRSAPGPNDPPKGPPIWTGMVSRSTALRLPRGWGFVASAPSEVAWAEITVRRQRGSDVARFIADRAPFHVAFREDAPFSLDAVDPAPDSIFGSPDGLRDRLVELDLDSLATMAAADWRARLARATPESLARVLGGPTGAFDDSLGGLMVVDRLPPNSEQLRDHECAVAGGGLVVRGLPSQLAALLESDSVGEPGS